MSDELNKEVEQVEEVVVATEEVVETIEEATEDVVSEAEVKEEATEEEVKEEPETKEEDTVEENVKEVVEELSEVEDEVKSTEDEEVYNKEEYERIKAEIEEMKVKAEEYKEAEAERLEKVHFTQTVQQIDKDVKSFETKLQEATVAEFKKYDIDTTKTIDELKAVDPTKAEVARKLLENAQAMKDKAHTAAKAAIGQKYQEIVFKKADKLLKGFDITEEQAPVIVDTLLQIINQTGVKNLEEDLKAKVELAVAKGYMAVPEKADVKIADTTPEKEVTAAVEETPAPVVEEVVEETPTKEDFMETVSGTAPMAEAPVGDVLAEMAALPAKDRIAYYQKNFNEITSAMKKANGGIV